MLVVNWKEEAAWSIVKLRSDRGSLGTVTQKPIHCVIGNWGCVITNNRIRRSKITLAEKRIKNILGHDFSLHSYCRPENIILVQRLYGAGIAQTVRSARSKNYSLIPDTGKYFSSSRLEVGITQPLNRERAALSLERKWPRHETKYRVSSSAGFKHVLMTCCLLIRKKLQTYTD